jgi:uncharacterized protein YggE
MRKVVLLVVGLVLVGAVLLSGCTSEGNASNDVGQGSWSTQDVMALLASDSSQQTGVWVTGTGEVAVVPDVAVLYLGVEAQAATVTEAQSDAAAAMTEVMSVLSANGVAEKDIQTRWYSISPVTKWIDDYKEQITIGYRVTNTVTAKIRDIGKVGAVIDAVAEAGGDLTRIEGIGFTVDDPDVYYDQAREEAILDAMAKAEKIASIANVTLGKPVYISESGGYLPPPYPVRGYAEGLDVATPISPGEMEISLTVQIGYALQ